MSYCIGGTVYLSCLPFADTHTLMSEIICSPSQDASIGFIIKKKYAVYVFECAYMLNSCGEIIITRPRHEYSGHDYSCNLINACYYMLL